ncbi:kelch-like protein 8 [Strongylocentrotus purpuratus]|uniref:BTB domain-containing protein n=1 Tax=Strongylocentrotus purpuratus TaxID=7668 RepID=A0A7M7N6G0_STRPU|nr:kelch-like protein 8 [Strongylocentrotus purpuratus]XP_030831885.1 kelch-like protein 8 [Strongylocentrotus purpuratus]
MDEKSKITLTATNKQEWPNSTLKSLNTFRQSGHSLCDVFLQGEDEMPMEPIPAHRCVLAANSVYFNAMFTSGLAESTPAHRTITISGVDTDILSLVVEFLYVGSCHLPSGTKHSRVMDLLTASTMLQVDELSRACTIYLEESLDTDNALELWLFAESYRISDLAETCKKVVQSYFWSISRSQRVLELDLQDMAAVLGLEEVNLGNAANEDTLVELLLRWLTYNPKALDSNLLPVLSKVCWSEVSQECKDKFRETLAEISKDSSSESFDAEKVFDVISKSSSLNQSFNRTFFCPVCAIGFAPLSSSTWDVYGHEPSTLEVVDIDKRTGTVLRQWSREFLREQFSFLPLRGHLYASSNTRYNTHYSSTKHIDVLCLSVANVKNTKVMRTRSLDEESVWLNVIEKQHYTRAIDEETGIVYLCGDPKAWDQSRVKTSTQVFKLDIENNVCSQLTSLPFERCHDRAVVVEGDLFVFGSVDRSPTPVSTVLKYDWKNNAWQEVSPMHESRKEGAYACVDGKIYASGGWTSKARSRNVEMYDPSLDIWTKLSPMSLPRVNHGLVAVGMYLFAMGGESTYSEEDIIWNGHKMVERYSITEGCWEAAWEMAECREGMRAFTL